MSKYQVGGVYGFDGVRELATFVLPSFAFFVAAFFEVFDNVLLILASPVEFNRAFL
jgi:hypothetical protein